MSLSLSLSRKKRARDLCIVNGSQNEQEVPTKRRNFNNGTSQYNNLSQSQRLSGVEDTRRCGKLLSMRLTNFMCHSHTFIDFYSRVNFVVGSNGSGKSAILAALVLGLGGNARATNRSRSAKGFIKTGEATAKIEIDIANDGPQPYEPEVYGDKITVVRTITTTSGSYVIKNANGVVITKKVDDLHRILMYHNVQVDNPVFVLNQDSAREFLKDLEPSKNYSLFLKATQIDVVMEKLNECLHLHKAHMYEVSIYKTKLQKQREDIADNKDKLKELIAFEQLKDVLARSEIELEWLLVKQNELKLTEINEKLDKYAKKEKEVLQLIQNKDEVNLVFTNEIKKYENLIASKNNEYNQENKQHRDIQNKVDKFNKLLAESQIALDSLKKKKNRLEKQMSDLKHFIEYNSNSNQEDVDASRAQNENNILKYRQQCETHLAPIIENLKRELKLLNDNKAQNEQVIREIKRQQDQHKNEIRSKNAQIATVKASARDKLLIYGNHMPQLINEIKTAHSQGKFAQLPRGPIGSYIEVPNSQYRDIVETAISTGFLSGFIVDNSNDRITLEKMLSKYSNNRPVVVTTKFRNEVYNVSHGCVKPPPGTLLLMQEIKCSDAVVMNCLIDRVQIEAVLLTNNKNIAEEITSNAKNVPRNLSKIIVLNEGNIALEYYPMPKYRMYSMKIRQANFIQVNIEERLRYLETEKLTLENKCKTLDNDIAHMHQQLPKDLKHIQEKLSLLKNQENEHRELQEKIDELRNVEYADYSSEIQQLKKEMEETEVRLEEVERNINDKRIEISESTSEKERIEQDLKTQNDALQEIQNEIESHRTQADQIKMKLRSIKDNDSTYCNKLTELQEKIEKVQNDKTEMVKNLKIAIDAAKEKGERADTEETLDQIQDKIATIKAKLKHGKPVKLEPQSMHELIQAKEDELEASQGTFDNIKSSIDTLRKSLKFRFDFLKKLKEHMAVLLQLSFSMILKLRNFEGCLDVSHKDKTLKISVIPRDHNKNAVSSTKSLSGGERSYSTVAFLISLWSCVDHPFYFLDEYDVFTDEVNREYMTRLLVDEGRKRPLRQYSFLTPQDMALASESFIQIIRLSEPDRR